MKSKSLALLITLAVLIAIRYGINSWVQPTLHSYASGHGGGFSIAGGLLSIFNSLHMMLSVGTLGVVILIARSIADAFASRNVRRPSLKTLC
ncbi:MAG: hypothetical protein JWO89_1386 [Verrucomicrobiaceae bacterium]|nr:hypothetical protein [Verrucomicrobiaceae bacterium]